MEVSNQSSDIVGCETWGQQVAMFRQTAANFRNKIRVLKCIKIPVAVLGMG